MRKSIIFITTAFFICISRVESVSLITRKCKSEDSKCIREVTQEVLPIFTGGLPEYGVPTLDPVTFKKIDASSPNLKLILTDVSVTGLKNCIPKTVKRDKSKSKLFLKLLCSSQLEGQYEMKGKLLFLPIEGQGPLHVTLRQAEISVDIDLEQNGEKWNVKEYKHGFKLKDKSDVVFENLFNGNEDLAKAVREVISNSGNDIILEVGPPVIQTIVDKAMKAVTDFFHAVPAQELSLD